MIPETTFHELIARCGADKARSTELWLQILKQYSAKKRHYHNLHHLESLLKELSAVKEQIRDWDTILFSLYYHDIIYNPLRKNNEDKSAAFAAKALQSIQVPEDKIEYCCRQIMATQHHQQHADNDTNLFTDADLSILGAEPDTYKAYSIAVRKEYAVYPNLLYKPGRKKVLQHFLQMGRIFKTGHFFKKYESQARKNLLHELKNG